MPKNLSLPSGRIAPAFWSIFSKGVISAGVSSFLLSPSFAEEPKDFYNYVSTRQPGQVWRRPSGANRENVSRKRDSKVKKHTAEPGFHLFRKLAMVTLPVWSGGGRVCRGSLEPASRRTAWESAEASSINRSRHPKSYFSIF